MARFEYRQEIDGLRAVAVLVVVVFHLSRTTLPGGFLGVDVFFVISGYLITTLLIQEKVATGRISLPAFWTRRVRRLLPALLLVIVVVAAVASLAADELMAIGLRGDLLSSVFYVANWNFIFEGQSYVAEFTAASPVLHTWSLSIEEQFYILWPVVFGLLFTGLRPRRRLAIVVGVSTLASVVLLARLFDPTDTTRAYFGTDARIHEILVGVGLAVLLTSRFRQLALDWGRRLAPLAATGLVVAFFTIADDSSVYYRGGSLVVALASAIVIGGMEGGSRLRGPLASSPLVAVGKISYGVYLWHFPIIIFVGERIGPPDRPVLALGIVAVTLVVSALSYRLLEQPIRKGRSRWLKPRRLVALVPAASAAVAIAVVFVTPSASEVPAWASPAGAERVGLNATTRTTLVEDEGGDGTAVTAPEPASPRIGIVGDSVMVSALPGFLSEAERRGWELLSAAHPACPVGYEPLYAESGEESPYNAGCAERVKPDHDALIQAEPDLVIWHDLQSVLSRHDDSENLLIAGTESWSEDLVDEWTAVLDRFLTNGIEVLLVLPPLRSQDPIGCDGAANLARCAEIQRQDELIRIATLRFWKTVDGRPGVLTTTMDHMLCPSGMPCPGIIEGLEVRLIGRDQTHLTAEGAEWFASILFDLAATQLVELGIP